MPTYDYVCTSCGHEMEIMHSLHGHGPDACPLCGAPMKKTFGVPTVHFKGTGWARKERATAKPSKAGTKGARVGRGFGCRFRFRRVVRRFDRARRPAARQAPQRAKDAD